MALLGGATGAIVPFFFLHRSESFSGFAAFGLAIAGLIVGSLLKSSVHRATALRVGESV
jgi:hypothetical protein